MTRKGTTSTPPAPPQSLRCPRCGCGHFEVLSTRRAGGNRILRRRQCRYCGRPLTTYEPAPG